MTNFELICAALGAGLGALIGALFWRKLSDRRHRWSAVFLSVFAFVYLAPWVASALRLEESLFPEEAINALFNQYSNRVLRNPAFVNSTKNLTPIEQKEFADGKAKLGLIRLPNSDLRRWNEIRLTLAEKNEKLCAAFWTGKGLDSELINTLFTLEVDDANSWIQISTKAMLMEIEEKPFDPPAIDALQKGLRKIAFGLSTEETRRFNHVFYAGFDADNEDACWMMKLILTRADHMPPDEQEQFLRALSAL